MMPNLVKGDDIRSGKKANARHGRLREAQEFLAFSNLVGIVFSNVAQKDPLLENWVT